MIITIVSDKTRKLCQTCVLVPLYNPASKQQCWKWQSIKTKTFTFFYPALTSVLKKHQRRKDRHHGGWSATKSTPIGDERFNRARSNIKPRNSRHSLQGDKKISFQFLYQPHNQQGCRDFKTDIPEAPSHRVIRMIWQMSDKNDLLLQ